MLSESMCEAMNKQINAELYSSYLYLSMAAYFESINLSGASNWMKCQAQEELVHVMKFFSHVAERGGRIRMEAIEGPPTEWDSPLAAFTHAYEHEQKVTGLINKLVDLARSESDHASDNFLQWFVAEQVEEESSTDAVVQKLKLAGDRGNGLFMIDRELAQRVFTPPPAQGQTASQA